MTQHGFSLQWNQCFGDRFGIWEKSSAETSSEYKCFQICFFSKLEKLSKLIEKSAQKKTALHKRAVSILGLQNTIAI